MPSHTPVPRVPPRLSHHVSSNRSTSRHLELLAKDRSVVVVVVVSAVGEAVAAAGAGVEVVGGVGDVAEDAEVGEGDSARVQSRESSLSRAPRSRSIEQGVWAWP